MKSSNKSSHSGKVEVRNWKLDLSNFQFLTSNLHFSGVTGFDRKFSLPVCKTEADVLPKKCPNLSANKTARGVLSPIQVADLGLVFA